MQNLSWRKHIFQTLSLAIPVCLSNVGHIAVDLADNYFIGQLPEKTYGQAAVSLAGALYIMILVLLIGVSYGLTPIVAEANAQNKTFVHSKYFNFNSPFCFIDFYCTAVASTGSPQ